MSQALELIEPGHPKWVEVGPHGAKVGFVPSILREGLDAKFCAGREKRCRIHLAPQVLRNATQQAGLRSGSTAVAAVDLAKLHEDGAPIYRSVNDV
eukprot:1746783-Alexandrium_andersonii.AAC.1